MPPKSWLSSRGLLAHAPMRGDSSASSGGQEPLQARHFNWPLAGGFLTPTASEGAQTQLP